MAYLINFAKLIIKEVETHVLPIAQVIDPSRQALLTQFATWASSGFFPYEQKEIALGRHPMQNLYELVERKLHGEAVNLSPSSFDEVPKTLRENIYFEVWKQATDEKKEGESWGEDHALENPTRLRDAIKAVAETVLHVLPLEQKIPVYETIYQLAGSPVTTDSQWGANHAIEDPKRLIRALHRKNLLGIPGKQIKYFSTIEEKVQFRSCLYDLKRPELPCGQIGFHNGIMCSFEDAKANALRISDQWAQGFNLHCTYSATAGFAKDIASALLGQGGAVNPAVLHLLEQWQDFFETHPNEHRLLQFCHSRGAIETYNALVQLPPELRQRIIVIAIAPACLIPEELAYQVKNFVIPSDPVVVFAANRQLITTSTVQPEHTDTDNPHSMFGDSFHHSVLPLVTKYIDENVIE
jgi:hypothetical protein